jgi:hypothetical protein
MILGDGTEVRMGNTYGQGEVGDERESKEMDRCPLTMSLGRIGTGLRDTTAPSAVTWIPTYGRLGTRRLGTVLLCISFVD